MRQSWMASYIPVPNTSLSRPWRWEDSARRKRANFPCGRTTVWVNCSRLRPTTRAICASASPTRVTGSSSGSPSTWARCHSLTVAFWVVVPWPRRLARS